VSIGPLYQYQVYYDVEVEGVWKYNQIYRTDLRYKGKHELAEGEAEEWIRANIACDDYRVTKVVCD
jgi:hypothetical protein